MSMALWSMAGVLLVGLLLRVPIGFAMMAAGIAYLGVSGQDLGLAVEQIGNGLYQSYVLLAVPLWLTGAARAFAALAPSASARSAPPSTATRCGSAASPRRTAAACACGPRTTRAG